MADGSARWSPEHVWGLLDQTLLNLKLQEISEQMQREYASDKSTVHWETQQKGNSAYYAPERCRRAVKRADEIAEQFLQACLDVWKTQGQKPCPGLYRMVHPRLLTTVFAARESSVRADMMAEVTRTGRDVNTRAALAEFAREMQRLSHQWQRKLEILAKECEHQIAQSTPTFRETDADSADGTWALRAQLGYLESPEALRNLIEKEHRRRAGAALGAGGNRPDPNSLFNRRETAEEDAQEQLRRKKHDVKRQIEEANGRRLKKPAPENRKDARPTASQFVTKAPRPPTPVRGGHVVPEPKRTRMPGFPPGLPE